MIQCSIQRRTKKTEFAVSLWYKTPNTDNHQKKRYSFYLYFILSSSKELTSWVKLQVEIFCKASRRRALQKICICSLTHDVSSLEDDNVFVFCVVFF